MAPLKAGRGAGAARVRKTQAAVDIQALQADALQRVAAADTPGAVEALRVEFLGKQGSISALLKTLGGMSPEQRQAEGPRIHSAREAVTAALAERKAALEAAALDARLAAERIDLTLPAPQAPRGSVHPVSQVMDELAEIFADLGFAVATGPEIEDDWHNFTALNMPESHPARAMHDTFYFPGVDGEGRRMLLRTHTSPVQIRTMQAVVKSGRTPPIRIICPGRVYRVDSDRTHSPMFHQVEGLYVAEGVTFADLKYDLQTFLSRFFETEVKALFRPSYFPFVEPGADVHMWWNDAEKGTGRWLELLGCGMVHPKVFEAVGLDPERYTGYAFGMGIDRLTMLRYGVNDLRLFFDNDLRFLSQFRTAL
jgi:phenylalanyl-tRNA synthetase alpha chain